MVHDPCALWTCMGAMGLLPSIHIMAHAHYGPCTLWTCMGTMGLLHGPYMAHAHYGPCTLWPMHIMDCMGTCGEIKSARTDPGAALASLSQLGAAAASCAQAEDLQAASEFWPPDRNMARTRTVHIHNIIEAKHMTCFSNGCEHATPRQAQPHDGSTRVRLYTYMRLSITRNLDSQT